MVDSITIGPADANRMAKTIGTEVLGGWGYNDYAGGARGVSSTIMGRTQLGSDYGYGDGIQDTIDQRGAFSAINSPLSNGRTSVDQLSQRYATPRAIAAVADQLMGLAVLGQVAQNPTVDYANVPLTLGADWSSAATKRAVTGLASQGNMYTAGTPGTKSSQTYGFRPGNVDSIADLMAAPGAISIDPGMLSSIREQNPTTAAKWDRVASYENPVTGLSALANQTQDPELQQWAASWTQQIGLPTAGAPTFSQVDPEYGYTNPKQETALKNIQANMDARGLPFGGTVAQQAIARSIYDPMPANSLPAISQMDALGRMQWTDASTFKPEDFSAVTAPAWNGVSDPWGSMMPSLASGQVTSQDLPDIAPAGASYGDLGFRNTDVTGFPSIASDNTGFSGLGSFPSISNDQSGMQDFSPRSFSDGGWSAVSPSGGYPGDGGWHNATPSEGVTGFDTSTNTGWGGKDYDTSPARDLSPYGQRSPVDHWSAEQQGIADRIAANDALAPSITDFGFAPGFSTTSMAPATSVTGVPATPSSTWDGSTVPAAPTADPYGMPSTAFKPAQTLDDLGISLPPEVPAPTFDMAVPAAPTIAAPTVAAPKAPTTVAAPKAIQAPRAPSYKASAAPAQEEATPGYHPTDFSSAFNSLGPQNVGSFSAMTGLSPATVSAALNDYASGSAQLAGAAFSQLQNAFNNPSPKAQTVAAPTDVTSSPLPDLSPQITGWGQANGVTGNWDTDTSMAAVNNRIAGYGPQTIDPLTGRMMSTTDNTGWGLGSLFSGLGSVFGGGKSETDWGGKDGLGGLW